MDFADRGNLPAAVLKLRHMQEGKQGVFNRSLFLLHWRRNPLQVKNLQGGYLVGPVGFEPTTKGL